MRKLSTITAPILPSPYGRPLSYGRRRVRAVFDSLTCLVLIRHQEEPTQIFVSDDGDAVGAVWLHKSPILIDPKDRGPFLVVTLTRSLAQQKGLSACVLDWERYTPAERVLLKEAVDTAKRTRDRLGGRIQPLPFPGRNAFA